MVEKTKSLSARGKKKELVFAGAAHLLGTDPKRMTPADVVAHKARMLVAKALGIPANTVVVLGNQPYVDNHGRKYKMEEYAKGAQFEYEYTQIATDDKMKAIVKCRISVPREQKDKRDGFTKNVWFALCGWAIGECSPMTIKMGTLNGYQNHLAQTRAENRAFEAAFGTRFRKDLYEGIGKALGMDASVIDTDNPEVSLALEAGNTSAEEAVPMRQKGAQPPASFDPFKKAKLMIERAETVQDLEALRARVKGSTHLKEKQINALLELINEKLVQVENSK